MVIFKDDTDKNNVRILKKGSEKYLEAIKYREDKIKERWIEVQYGSSLQKVFTPFVLVLEMLEKVRTLDNRDVCVLTNSEIYLLIKTLKKEGKKNFQYKTLTLITDIKSLEGKDNVKVVDFDNIEKVSLGMKFDVVIGNPPYNDSGDSNNQIYQHFWNLAFDLGRYVALVVPYNMLEGISKGNIDKVKVSTHIPQYVEIDITERYFKGRGVDILFFICDKEQKSKVSTLKTPSGSFEIDIISESLKSYLSEESINYTQKHFKKVRGDRSISSADAGKEAEGSEILVYDNVRGEPREIALPTKRFKTDPYKPKVLFNIYNSGKPDEFILDTIGNVLPSNKHNLFFITFETSEEAQNFYNDLHSERFLEYSRIFNSRGVIQSYLNDVY